MNGDDIKSFAEDVLDGQVIPTDFFYTLLNIAKNKLEGERLWQFLKKLDSSKTAAGGSNPDTEIDLPDDFAEDYKLEVGINNPYYPVPFEEQHIHRSSSNRYVLDIANESFKLLGNVVSGTIYLFYKRFTPDISSSTSPVFPARFHPILGFMVAGYYQMGVDSDDIFARMGPVNRAAAIELLEAMRNWDTALKLRSQNDRVGMESGDTPEVPLAMM